MREERMQAVVLEVVSKSPSCFTGLPLKAWSKAGEGGNRACMALKGVLRVCPPSELSSCLAKERCWTGLFAVRRTYPHR